MLPSVNQPESRATRRTLLFLGVLAAASLALPMMNLTTPTQPVGPTVAVADDSAPTDTGKAAAGVIAARLSSEPSGRNAAPVVEYLPRPSKFEEKVIAALDKSVDIEFLDLSLEDCIVHLQELSQIPMLLDKQTLTDEGVALNQPVTLKLKAARLASALNWMLKPLQLVYVVEDDLVVITTGTKAGEQRNHSHLPGAGLYQGRGQPEVGALPQRPAATAGDGA